MVCYLYAYFVLGAVVRTSWCLDGPSHFYPFGTDDGDVTAPTNDDDSTGRLPISTGFPYFDHDHTSLFVNTNGAISFLSQLGQYTPDPFPLDSDRRLITPFWADVHTGINHGRVYYRESQSSAILSRATADVRRTFVDLTAFTATWVFIATWYEVTYFGGNTTTPVNTFQAVLITNGFNSFVIFNYDDVTWTTGTASGGINGLGGTPAQAGFNAGDGIVATSVQGSRTPAIIDIDKITNVGLPGRLMFRVDKAGIMSGGCNNGGLLSMGPRYDTTFGGRVVTLSGPCLEDADVAVVCRFAEMITVPGQVVDATRATCRVPSLLLPPGRVILEVSTNGGQNYSHSGLFVIVRGKEFSQVNLQNIDDIAMGDLESSIRITWDKNLLETDRVDVDFVIFAAKSQSGSETQLIEIPITKQLENSGAFSLPVHLPQAVELVFSNYGAIRIKGNGAGNILWSIEHQATWYVNAWMTETLLRQARSSKRKRRQLTLPFPNSPIDEASGNIKDLFLFEADELTQRLLNAVEDAVSQKLQDIHEGFKDIKSKVQNKVFGAMCRAWADSENNYKPPSDGPSCPCNRLQADNEVRFTGRFEVDGACNNGEGCSFHPGATHCVRSASPNSDGGGEQCCYGPGDEAPLLVTIGSGGGTYDRHHPDSLVNHFWHDVRTYFFCCEWSESCDAYTRNRPTDDCSDYDGLGSAFSTGDPHITSLDGFTYTFNGYGEYVLVQAGSEFTLQGRMAPLSTNTSRVPTKGTVWRSFAAQAKNSDMVEIRFNQRTSLDVLINGQLENFDDLSNQIFKGIRVYVNISEQIARVTFVDVEIALTVNQISNALNFVVMVPKRFQGQLRGLMGNFDGNSQNDMVSSSGTRLPTDSGDEDIHDRFGETWRIEEEDSLFSYEFSMAYNMTNDPAYRPMFFNELIQDTNSQLLARADSLCFGVQTCIFDYIVTGNEALSVVSLEQSVMYGDVGGTLQRECTADVIFVVDTNWIPAEWLHIRQLLTKTVENLDLNSGKIKLGFVKFSTGAEIIHPLDSSTTDPETSLLRVISEITAEHNTTTHNWYDALRLVSGDLLSSRGDRPTALNYVLMITGGQPSTADHQREVLAADVVKRRSTIITISAGLTSNGTENLGKLASLGSRNTLHYSSTRDLVDVADTLVDSVCRAAAVPDPVPTTPVPTGRPQTPTTPESSTVGSTGEKVSTLSLELLLMSFAVVVFKIFN